MNERYTRLLRLAPYEFYDSKELYSDGMEKILSLSAKARTTRVENDGKEWKVRYQLSLSVVYLNADNMVECREESEERETVIRTLLGGDNPQVTLEVRGVEYALSTSLKVRVMLEVKGVSFENYSLNLLDDGDLCVKKRVESICCAVPLKECEKAIIGTVKGYDNDGRILNSNAQIIVKKVSTATDIAEVEGEIQVSLITLSNGEVLTQKHRIPFKEDLLFEGLRDNSNLLLNFEVISLSLNAVGDGECEFSVLATVNGYFVNKLEVELPIDAFSKRKETSLEEEERVVLSEVKVIESKERFSETLPLDGIDDAVEVLSNGTPYFGALNLSTESGAVVEGVLCTELLLKRENDTLERTMVESPFSFRLNESLVCAGDISVKLALIDFSSRLRFGSQVEISGEIKIELECTEERVVKYLKGVTYLCDREECDAVISVYLVGEGETLFDCAKALVSDEEELLSLNPELTLPLKAGDKVLLYRSL